MGDLARQGGPDPSNPLTLLPVDWRAPTSYFFAFHSDLLRGTTGLVTRLQMWAKEEGLTLDEAKEAMQRMMKPARVAACGYAGALLAALAGEVDEIVKARKAKEKTAELRQRVGRPPDAVSGDDVRDVLKRYGYTGPTGGDSAAPGN